MPTDAKLLTALAAAGLVLAASPAALGAATDSGPFDELKKKLPKAPKAKTQRGSRDGSGERRTTTSRVSQQDRTDAAAVTEVLDRILKFRFDIYIYEWDDAGVIDKAESQLSAFRADMNEAISADIVTAAGNDGNRRMARVEERATRFAEGYEAAVAKLDIDRLNDESDAITVFQKYAPMLLLQERLRQLQRLFPGNAEIASAMEGTDAVLGQLGGLAAVKDRQEANYAKYVAETRMYPAVRSDPAMERDFVRAFWASSMANDLRGGKVERIHLTSSRWAIEHNALGQPVARTYSANLGISASDGKCWMKQGVFAQKYAGGGWGGTFYRSGDTREMLCENIPG